MLFRKVALLKPNLFWLLLKKLWGQLLDKLWLLFCNFWINFGYFFGKFCSKYGYFWGNFRRNFGNFWRKFGYFGVNFEHFFGNFWIQIELLWGSFWQKIRQLFIPTLGHTERDGKVDQVYSVSHSRRRHHHGHSHLVQPVNHSFLFHVWPPPSYPLVSPSSLAFSLLFFGLFGLSLFLLWTSLPCLTTYFISFGPLFFGFLFFSLTSSIFGLLFFGHFFYSLTS